MQFDAIVILAGGIRDDGELPESVKKRIQKGKELFTSELAPRVIMSGRWSWLRRKPSRTEAEAMREYALKIGFERKQLYLEESSSSTEENAYYTKKILLEPNKWKRIVVVTSDFHLRRVKHIFNQVMGNEYEIRYEGADSGIGLLKRVSQQVKEGFQIIIFRFLEPLRKTKEE